MTKAKEPIRIAVVDDQKLFRKGLIAMIEEYRDFEVVLEAGDGKEFIDWIKNFKPQVVLLDVDMPVMDGVATTEYLRERFPKIKIIILTTYDDAELIYLLAQKGAHGFLLKDSELDIVAEAINTVMRGEHYFRGKVNEKLMHRMTQPVKAKWSAKRTEEPLSGRELEIMRMIC